MKPVTLPYNNFYYQGDYTLEFIYGHDKQRRKTTFYDNGLAIEKYFAGLYEKEIDHQTGVTRHINYITAGDGMTAIVLQEEESGSTTEETYFTYKDHLGSIVALTDETGDVVLEQSFDAWGRYRDPNDWSYNILNPSPTWLRGYTGHEHLPHFDLINMNGRIYDPLLGRMLSPDKYIQDPLFSQSYNRYSYVWNNPLRYTDPSGDAVVASVIIGAVVGAYIGGSIANNTYSISDWSWKTEEDKVDWETIAGIGIGATVGAFGGWAVGAKINTGAISAQQLGGNILAGTMNAAYNYESGQGALTTMGYFGAGFLGSQIGLTGGAGYGMFGGGLFTAGVGATHMPDEHQGYYLLQKFVGGALSSYAGMVFGNPKLGYLKYKGSYFANDAQTAKTMSYSIQNVAQRFAYTDRDSYLEAGLFANLIGPAIYGGIVGGLHYEVNKNISAGNLFKGEGSFGQFFNDLDSGRRLARFGVGLGVYGIDYMMNTWNAGYSNPFTYSGFGQKASVGSTKSLFYYLLTN